MNDNGYVAQEIYRGSDGLYRFRYIAWVGWRDAGDHVRSHSWHELPRDAHIIADDFDVAREFAEKHASTKDITFSSWKNKL